MAAAGRAHLGLALGLALLAAGCARPSGTAGESPVVTLYRSHAGDVWVECRGTVERVLADDVRPPRHERFIVRVADAEGLTILVAHNLDLAPRVPLAPGDTVELRGLYEWNAQGGVVHETHHAAGTRAAGAGWVRLRNVTYQ